MDPEPRASSRSLPAAAVEKRVAICRKAHATDLALIEMNGTDPAMRSDCEPEIIRMSNRLALAPHGSFMRIELRALHETVDRRLAALIALDRAANALDEARCYSLLSPASACGRC